MDGGSHARGMSLNGMKQLARLARRESEAGDRFDWYV
jgi:hypothetical protein